MDVKFRYFDRPDGNLLGKIILRPESAEEQAELEKFRVHVKSPQKGRKLEVVYRNRKPKETREPEATHAS